MIRYILSYTKSEMSSFFCGKFVFFVSFQHLVSAFFSSTTLCVAGVPSAPPLGDFRKSDRQCMLSPAHAPCGSTHSIEFAQQIHKFRGRVPRNLYKGRKNVPAGRGFSSASLESVVSSERLFAKQPQKVIHSFRLNLWIACAIIK